MLNNHMIIQNALFGQYGHPNTSKFNAIGTKGFTILSFLVYQSGNYQFSFTSKGQIAKFTGLDRRAVDRYLKLLIANKLIEVDNNPSGANDLFLVDLSNYYNLQGGYELLPKDIFQKFYYKELDPVSWSILCLLSKMHNVNFGNELSSQGFTSISEQSIGEYINTSKNTINKYVEVLKKLELIKVKDGKDIIVGYSVDGSPAYQYSCNQYFINHKEQKQSGK